MTTHLRIGIVAGESSGDILGASLIRSLKKKHPDLVVEGIGGPLMIEQGCKSFFAIDRLSVMGLVEPLKRLPELLHIRSTIKKYFLQNPPDVFIGIDSPDFTLNIEKTLKQNGIKTVHYVSPSVWAWRQGRIHTIAQCVDRMLTLFPFEQSIYKQHNIPVTFVGHPLADEFPLETDAASCKKILGLPADKTFVALLPGSRESEVRLLAPIFFSAAKKCHQQHSGLHFLIPAVNAARKQQLQKILQEQNMQEAGVSCALYDGQSHAVMGASDLVVMASGTTTLEAMLLKKPMVVAYKMAPLSYAIISRLLKTPYVSLPNLLAQKMLVPELIQQHATADTIASETLALLNDKNKVLLLKEAFIRLHLQLKSSEKNGDAGDRAAQAVLDVISGRAQ